MCIHTSRGGPLLPAREGSRALWRARAVPGPREGPHVLYVYITITSLTIMTIILCVCVYIYIYTYVCVYYY